MWRLGTWFNGELGRDRFTVGLYDLKSPFQPKRFYDSMQTFLVRTILYGRRTNIFFIIYFHLIQNYVFDTFYVELKYL